MLKYTQIYLIFPYRVLGTKVLWAVWASGRAYRQSNLYHGKFHERLRHLHPPRRIGEKFFCHPFEVVETPISTISLKNPC